MQSIACVPVTGDKMAGMFAEGSFVADYVKNHPLSPALQARLKNGTISRCIDVIAKQMKNAAKIHITGSFEDRSIAHIAAELEQQLWGHREDDFFDKNVKDAASVIFNVAIRNIDSSTSIVDFLEKERGDAKVVLHDDWDDVLLASYRYYRDIVFKNCREPAPPRKKKPRGPASFFRYNLKVTPERVMPLLQQWREEDALLRQCRGRIWEAINVEQPKLTTAKTHAQVIVFYCPHFSLTL